MIEMKLKCACTDGEVTLPCRERGPEEDILAYMEYVQGKVGAWHQKRMCSATELEYLKIPITDDKPIGAR